MDFDGKPSVFCSKLLNSSPKKLSNIECHKIIERYFYLYKQKVENPLENDIFEEIYLICLMSEKLSEDPVYMLFECGLVFFDDILIVNSQKLAKITSIDKDLINLLLKGSNSYNFRDIPEMFFIRLEKLGYIDCIYSEGDNSQNQWQVYHINHFTELSIYLKRYSYLVHSCPKDLYSIIKESISSKHTCTADSSTTPLRDHCEIKKHIISDEGNYSD